MYIAQWLLPLLDVLQFLLQGCGARLDFFLSFLVRGLNVLQALYGSLAHLLLASGEICRKTRHLALQSLDFGFGLSLEKALLLLNEPSAALRARSERCVSATVNSPSRKSHNSTYPGELEVFAQLCDFDA